MFDKFINALKTLFGAKPVSLQFEEMLLQDAVQKIKDADAAREKAAAAAAVAAEATVAKVEVVAKTAAPKVKAPKTAKAKTAVKAPAKKPKKPNIKIVK
jgi:hypothetical protein